ncbi:hypothetical protein BFP76_06920 [Amylibacter kogurei]|uniref:histidine kinase n=1 Tax=Paramylibacter kogurei TaxID=1889778 RepID=A0A2G5K5R4_9RHOB|nr:ATP-binding protein [Amylibacter kogurei]PIB24887.1 hypothetical protein BFP76_06920 [Amylibacter kogurei]
MSLFHLRRYMPKTLMGRSILILMIPIVVIQLVVGFIFFDRLFRDVTLLKTGEVARQLEFALQSSDPDALVKLGFEVETVTDFTGSGDSIAALDFTGQNVIEKLRTQFSNVAFVDLTTDDHLVQLGMNFDGQFIKVSFDRARASARNPHQLLVAMTIASLIMSVLAVLFLRNQVKPIRLLAKSAEAFGKGRNIPFRARGAAEVRLAAHAFRAMKERIEQQIQQRTLMLSGVSHDLRTPLTRMKLSLSMLEDNEEIEHLRKDVIQMEGIMEEFLAFARGDSAERRQQVDVAALAQTLVENNKRAGKTIVLNASDSPIYLTCRKLAMTRALDNLLSNAAQHGDQVSLTIHNTEKDVKFSIEDNGPGINPKDRETAMRPFERLDSARNQNQASGSGLGLAIVADIARSHGGNLALSDSKTLHGLCATITIPK